MGIGLDCDMGHRKDSCIISKNLILLLFLGITNVNCLSQDNSFKFRRLTIEDGLSQSSVQSIAQDKEGYIWLATANGLNRYDGYEFKIFKNEIDNDSSLSNNRVEKIFIDSENRLWVGTAGGGLNLFNNKSGSFRRITLAPERSLSIKAIYESQDGMLWIGSGDGKLFKIDKHADDSFSTTSYHIIPDSLSAGYDINDITIYDNKLILGTARKGIIYFDPENEKFSEYYHTPYKHLLRNCFVNDFYIDKQHNLWVATDDEGMFVFQGGFETATHIDYENFWVDGLLCNNIYALAEDQHGFLWVGTKGGLNVSAKKISDYEDFGSLSFSKHVYSPSNQKSLSNNFVLSIFEDQTGLLWVGTSADGINLFHRGSELFNYFQKIEGLPNSLENETIMSVYDDEKGTIWIGSDGGLIKFDKHKRTFKNYWNELDNVSFKYNTIMSITELEYGKLLLGTYGGGLVIFDQFNEQYTLLINDAYSALDLNQRILTTYKDRHGNIWVGTDGDGILKFRYDKNIQEIKFIRYKHISNNTNSVSHNDIWKFFEDEQGTLWIGTVGGLNRYHPGEDIFTRYQHIPHNKESLSSNRVYCINNLDTNRLLIGTDNGLNIFEKTTGKFEYFTEKDGLPDNVIYGILEGSDNHFWLSTNNGISRFNYGERTFKNYSATDGLPSNEFNTGAYFKNSRGELFFGSTKGLLWFDPSDLQSLTNQFVPSIVISEVEVKGLEKIFNVNTAKTLKLKHDQNTITLSFAALDYASPSKNQYAYKLDQLDQDWTHIGNRRFVTFSNLAPGRYNFSVKGSNNDGVWSEAPAALQFIIHPPWYATWWTYVVYIVAAGLIIYWFYHFQLSKKLVLAESKRLKEINQLKNSLYTNITHEFRTPLTVILGMTNSLKANGKDKDWEDSNRSLEMIERNGNKLLHLVNEMLDLAKLESGSMELQMITADVVPFVKYLCESFQSFAEESGINLVVYSEIDELVMDFDTTKLSAIISNLLSNAIKFTPEGGKIVVHLNEVLVKNKAFFFVKVKDTGIGISEDTLPHVFNRFYQAENTSSQYGEGTGIGLALTKELVELMGGTIDAKSTLGKGSEFVVELPISNTANKVAETPTPLKPERPIAPEEQQLANEVFDADADLPLALIIEDSIDVAYYLTTCLRGKYKTLHALNGSMGLDMAYEHIPDVVICDVLMPEKNGFEVCSTLKSDERTDHVPVIMLTAKVSSKDRLSGLAHGADAYLAKPFNIAELHIRLDQLLQLRKRMMSKIGDDGFSTFLKRKVENPETKFLQKAIKIIHTEMDNDIFGPSSLARKLHLSESQLYRKLKAISGKSTAVFIRSVRLQKAKELLQTTNKTISEIAYEVGFSDPSWFSRAFKEEFGYAPSEMHK